MSWPRDNAKLERVRALMAERELDGFIPARQVDDDVPVVLPRDLGLPGLCRFARCILGLLLIRSGRHGNRDVLPSLLDGVPARHEDLRRQLVGLDEAPHDVLGLARVHFARRIEEEPRAVACDHQASAQPPARLVVQVERAQPLADRVPVLVVVELDLDPKLVLHHEDATSDPPRAHVVSSHTTRPSRETMRPIPLPG